MKPDDKFHNTCTYSLNMSKLAAICSLALLRIPSVQKSIIHPNQNFQRKPFGNHNQIPHVQT